MALMTRRVALAVVASSVLTQPARAGIWPNRTVRLITSAPPGVSPDMVARLFGERLAKLWDQAVVVDNRPGADGILAVQGLREIAAAENDHALLVAPTTVATVTPVLKEKLPFDPVGDLQPIATAASLKTVAMRLDGWLAMNEGGVPPKGRWREVAAEIGVSPEALYRELAKRRASNSTVVS